MQVATDAELSADIDEDDDAVEDIDGIDDHAVEPDVGDVALPPKKLISAPRRAMLLGLAVVVALAALVGWFGLRGNHSHQAQAQRNLYLHVAKQGALNLTTIDWQHADADVHRILDGATGEFYDDFAKRSQPFIEVLKQSKAKTVGTISEAGLESEATDSARALVIVSVQTSNNGEAEQVPKEWRMRIDVQKIGGQVKVSNVGFVP
ncbi:mammalian cell entry protein [Mycobacterium sp.]|uniref:mammalian cell entry protein n=1 Tax=Mycobacterium sp. TaxID=1785 RepID=UPI003F965F1C